MAKHRFGGDWTADKLERVRKYLAAYTTIFHRNPKARYFRTIYVDAFAGTGWRSDSRPESDDAALPGVFLGTEADDMERYKKGSARIALEVEPPFDAYLFIERSQERCRELELLRAEFPRRTVRVVQGEANACLTAWCRQTDWREHRAVVFLDPYGMQVDWTTLEALALTRAVDLWLLFPIGQAVNRLLTREHAPPPEWSQALSRILGTEEWRSAFYRQGTVTTLFGEETLERKDATLADLSVFFSGRLKTIFADVAPNPLPLRNSTGTPWGVS